MATVIDFPGTAEREGLTDSEMLCWLAGYSLARYEAARLFSEESEACREFRKMLSQIADTGVLPLPPTLLDLRRKFLEAVNDG